MNKKIFVSHAVKDKPLADALVDLLQTGLNISSEDVFCSSLEGLGIPPGQNFVDYIKSQIQQPESVIILLTKNYYESHFCLCELGATWAMSHSILPLIVPPLKFSDINGVLTGVQINKIQEQSGLDDFVTQLKKNSSSSNLNLSRWGKKRDQFIDNLQAILETITLPKTVDPKEHLETLELLEVTREALDEADDKISILTKKVALLEKCKDKAEVKAVINSLSGAKSVFDDLVEDVSNELDGLPRIVSLVIYRYKSTGDGLFLDTFEQRDLLKEAEEATDHQYIYFDERLFHLNFEHPKIKRSLKSIEQLEKFIDSEDAESIHNDFEEEHDYLLSIENRTFWNEYLNSDLQRL
ncbi:hypothetical protein BI375_23820 [Vibrio rotiferianus]|uniref:TIR domain-containing protein n=1 Tax=Vibrio rotiferianus TaxID=190895 RepID=A0ABX3D523_9VIBR|nr:toll/interleukin-1 receptor domain-containing protein [Vibrio rotiferianus]OHY89329.1 hypothetical protein BI375_23820 [Vibrio rotiferianus]